jgi:dCMP deaminase
MELSNWDHRFLALAEFVAGWSKDPSTQVGAVVMRPDKTVASLGFNGFPRGVADDKRLEDRALKYELVVHAELNAILHAREPLAGYTLYTWPLPPCSRCAAAIIQAGIMRVVSPPPIERWRESCELAASILREAGVVVEVVP